LRILVVEDEAKVARALREGLEREKYEVVVAPTGEEGFFRVNAEEFDLVILDLMLPGCDGLEVLSTLKPSEVIVDHGTGTVAKTEPITAGEDFTEAKAQSEAMSKAKQSLREALAKF
jgi:CheY-like chemotaxis protein